VGALRRIYQSPGPILDPEADAPDYWGWAEAFHACGFRPCDVVQVTFGYHLTPAGLMLEEPLREIGCAVVPAGPGNTQVQLDLLRAVGATGFVGMASYLAVIGEKALAAGLDPRTDFRLQVAFVAAERLTDALRARVQEMFGMLVRQGYGTADAGCIAYECPEGAGMHLSSRCWVEICDPATGAPLPDGETGEVVATPFNPAYPLIRLATGDLSAMLPGACPCGRTARRLAGILGRVDDTAKVKGQFLYPSQAAGVMENFPAVARWQLRVANPGGRDRLEVALAVRGGAQALDEAAFRTAFGAVMKLAPALAIYDAATAEAARELPDGAPLLVDARTFE
jgi:phenylacetate-CoA ligase